MLRPRKRLGQHFLADPNTARKIVSALKADSGDAIVEIGPGTGALTGLLAERYDHVTAIEVDPRAASLIRESHPGVHVIEGDVLDIDWRRLSGERGAPLHVIGNLPYNITSQILFALIDSGDVLAEALVMTQYEVARRVVAVPRTKAYGILSVAVQLACNPEFLFAVAPTVFKPRPDVRSAVLRLDFSQQGFTDPESATIARDADPAWTRRVVRTAFNQRRKTLSNSLKPIVNDSALRVPLEFAGLRAEELTPGDFVRLARYLQAGR